MNQITVSSQFQQTAQEIESIFTSYKDLHSIYSSSIANLKQNLTGLPYSDKQKVHNIEKAFNNALRSVNIKQKQISDQLYSQGLVLMVGNAESITREMFRNLVRNNIRTLRFAKDFEVPFSRVAAANNDIEMGNIVLEILEEDRNPSSKLNFQNMQQMKGILHNYLGIEVPVYLIKELHEYWQVRHIIVHNSGIIDKKFLSNLKAADIATNKYIINKKVNIDRADYEHCFLLLVVLFEHFDSEIERMGLELR